MGGFVSLVCLGLMWSLVFWFVGFVFFKLSHLYRSDSVSGSVGLSCCLGLKHNHRIALTNKLLLS